jgi:hypothetical protein
MRNSLRPLAAAALAALVCAAVATAQVSERTQQALRERLPKFDPAKSDAARAANKVERPTGQEEGVTVLPDFQVLEKKVEQPDADAWLASGEITRREVRRAEAEMNALELALNRWHIPLISASFADRARANYEMKKRGEEMNRLTRLQQLPGAN